VKHDLQLVIAAKIALIKINTQIVRAPKPAPEFNLQVLNECIHPTHADGIGLIVSGRIRNENIVFVVANVPHQALYYSLNPMVVSCNISLLSRIKRI
jgi:hypothetical protein